MESTGVYKPGFWLLNFSYVLRIFFIEVEKLSTYKKICLLLYIKFCRDTIDIFNKNFDLLNNLIMIFNSLLILVVLDTNMWYHSTLNVGENISITIGSEFD